MRLATCFLVLMLTACAKQAESDPGVTCANYVSPYAVIYPDGNNRKSNVAECTDGYLEVTSLEDAESFSAHSLVVRVTDVDDTTGAVSYHYATMH